MLSLSLQNHSDSLHFSLTNKTTHHVPAFQSPGPIQSFIAAMFKKPNPHSLNWVHGPILPNVPWHDGPHDRNMVARQTATTPAAVDPVQVHLSVANKLFHLTFIDSLQPDIPSDFPG